MDTQSNIFERVVLVREDLQKAKCGLYQRLAYQPHIGQAAFHNAKERFKVLIAGSRFGKSLASVREVLPWLMLRGTRGWIVGPTYRLAEKEMRYMVSDLTKLGVPPRQFHFGGANGASSFESMWHSEVHALSAVHEHTLFGEEVDWMLLSEASQLKSELFTRVLRARLSSRKGVLVVPTTPKGYNWIHDLYQRGQDENYPDWKSFQFKTADNPMIDSAEVEEARRTLPPEDFAEQYEGAFTTRRGLIYTEFDPAIHIVDAPIGIEDASRAAGLDAGYSNPFAMIFGAELPDGRLYIYDEYYQSKLTNSQHLERLAGRDLQRLEMIYADPSAADAIGQFHQDGYPIARAPNGVLAGIDRVRQRLLVTKDGVPGLIIDRKCQNLIEEFSRYAWADQDRSNGESIPLKSYDHALDALRYLVMGLAKRTLQSRVR